MTTNKISHIIRDYKFSRFTKTIGLTEDDYNYINKNRGKKSRAGMLESILLFYKEKNGGLKRDFGKKKDN